MALFGLLKPNIEKLKARRDVAGLIQALEWIEKDEKVGISAALALGEIKDPQAVDALVPWLLSSRRRPAAAQALGVVGDLRAMEPLLSALINCRESADGPVTAALAKFGAPGIEVMLGLLQGQNDALKRAAARAFGNLKESRGVQPLVAALAQNPDLQTKEAITEALVQIGPLSVEPLVALVLGDGGLAVRRPAVECLAHFDDPRVPKALSALLEEKDESINLAAASALNKLGWQPESSRQRILLAALSGKWQAVAEEGAAAKGVLLELSSRLTHWRRESLARTLVQIDPEWFRTAPPERAIPILAEAFQTGDEKSQLSATAALAQIPETASAEVLSAALRAWSWGKVDIRSQLAETLVRLGACAVAPLVQALADGNDNCRKLAADSLTQIGPPAVEALIGALRDSKIRVEAAKILGRIKDVRAVEPLAKWAQGSRQDAISWAAGEALVDIGGPAIPKLLKAAGRRKGQPSSEAALAALGRTGAIEAVGLLVDVLQHEQDAGCLGKAQSSLWKILEAKQDQVATEELRAIASLADKKVSVYSTSDYSWDHGSWDDHKCDFSKLRDWAKEALAKRGLATSEAVNP
jgi:HEAT repeat protein